VRKEPPSAGRKIHAVVLNGRLLDRKSLDAMLAGLERGAAEGR
jgi:hypothetical protein